MTSQPHARRFAVRATFDKNQPYGAWWPRNRTLADQLDGLFASWPPHAGRIVRVLYSPPDWDDRPRSVAVVGRRVRPGPFLATTPTSSSSASVTAYDTPSP